MMRKCVCVSPPHHLLCTLQGVGKSVGQILFRPVTARKYHNASYAEEDFVSCNDQTCGNESSTLELLARLQHHGPVPTPEIINGIVSSCAKSASLGLGIQVHSAIVKMGFCSNVYICSALVDMYCKSGVISRAQKVFDEMRHKTVITWNSLISGYLNVELAEMAIDLFLDLLKTGMLPTPFSVSPVLVACSQLEAGDLGIQVHGLTVKAGYCHNVVVGTGLIDMYSKTRNIDDSRRLFNRMPDRNVITWTSMVTSYAQNQQPDEAMLLVREMQRSGLRPNYVTYNSLLSSFSSPNDIHHCKQVHCRIIREGLESHAYLAVTLVTVYSECGCSLEDFDKICSNVTRWDQISWNAIIAGFSTLGDGKESLRLFCRMRKAGISLDCFTFTSILRAAGIISALEVGKKIHALVLKTGYDSHLHVQNGLVSMYARCGAIFDSKMVFTSMEEHDLISWNSLLSGCAHHGHGWEAVKVFEQMRETGIKPDKSTYLSVISSCSHVGLLNKGLEYFDLMKSDDLLEPPKVEHYASIVDLFGRAGYLQEAEAFINSMPTEPGPSVYKALLSACQVHANMKIAVRSAEKLLELYPNDPATYVLLSNVLATEGFWDGAARVRKLMCDRGVDLDGMRRYSNSPKSPTTPPTPTTIEQLLRGDASRWPASTSPTLSPTFGKDHDPEEDHHHLQKKSVLAKVKEKAKKWRNTLSKKKHDHDGSPTTPSWGVTLDDDEDEEDAEYLGAPMYESELAPEGYKETAKKHPRAVPVISEKRVLASSVNRHDVNDQGKETEKEKSLSPHNKTITETVTEKLAPAYATKSKATNAITSNIQGLTVSVPPAQVTEGRHASEREKKMDKGVLAPLTVPPGRENRHDSKSERKLDASASSPPSAPFGTGGDQHANMSGQTYDKGVSVTEYLMQKLEPGEDERALSRVISDAISPRKSPSEMGVVEKVKEAVSYLLGTEESAPSTNKTTTTTTTTNPSSQIPISTNAHEAVEEENHGRILQAN